MDVIKPYRILQESGASNESWLSLFLAKTTLVRLCKMKQKLSIFVLTNIILEHFWPGLRYITFVMIFAGMDLHYRICIFSSLDWGTNLPSIGQSFRPSWVSAGQRKAWWVMGERSYFSGRLLMRWSPEIHHVYHMCWITEVGEVRSFPISMHHALRSADKSQIGWNCCPLLGWLVPQSGDVQMHILDGWVHVHSYNVLPVMGGYCWTDFIITSLSAILVRV